MKKLLIILAPLIVLFFAVSVNRIIAPEKRLAKNLPSPTSVSQTPKLTPTPSEISATFVIYTNNTKRIFTDTKYHGLSEYVYITAENPEKITVKRSGTTWEDFFSTLPMKLSPSCLTTGTNQQFCTNQTSSLKFFINGLVDRDALTKTIQNGDKLLVSYGPISDPSLPFQLAK